jgi:2-polyprenyl-3-methyl-5-hydroxy-6-metoxy-1,4-benzoquinol methylase
MEAIDSKAISDSALRDKKVTLQRLEYAPVISELLKRNGYRCENYDPIFFMKELNKKYDFIFSTEVFEHIFIR